MIALGQSRPFAGQSPDLLRWLADRVTWAEYAPGDRILQVGGRGDACYILSKGRVELLGHRSDGTTYRIAEIAAGHAFGVEALITGNPQTATARALTPVEVFRLGARDFEEVLARSPDCARFFLLLARQRARPNQAANVVAIPAPDDAGAYILKDPARYRYLRVTEPGFFLWELMDGERTVRDLSVAYFLRYRRFGVDEVLRTIRELRAGGFVDGSEIQPRLLQRSGLASRREQIARRLAPIVRQTYALPDPDRLLGVLYRYGLRLIYTQPVQIAFALIALVGLAVFGYTLASGHAVPDSGTAAVVALGGIEVQVLLHEFAHALTTKHFGREVHRVGIGWYFFLPIAFVDTSDMWLERRWRRIAVAGAGPYMNFVLAGAASCLLPIVGNGHLAASLLAFATAGYGLGALNLNPLYELDGYYVLSDLLGIPNLRARALAFLGTIIWRAAYQPAGRDRRWVFIGYGVAAAGYAIFAAGALLFGYQRLVQQLITPVTPPGIAAALGWVLAAAMALLLLLNLWQALRRWATPVELAVTD